LWKALRVLGRCWRNSLSARPCSQYHAGDPLTAFAVTVMGENRLAGLAELGRLWCSEPEPEIVAGTAT
jgi:hypothetical protein